MEQFIIYIWSISENIECFFLTVGLLLLIFSPFIIPMLRECTDMEDGEIFSILKKVFAIGIICVFCTTLIPAKKDLALLFMFPYIKQGTETVVKSETLNKLKTMTNLYLDEQIKNLKENKQ